MLGKLIKYDIKWINKVMVIYYLITFVFCVLTRVLSGFSDNFFLNIIFYAVRGMAIACFANVLINAIIRCWARLHTTTYKDESYLTHTLPVEKKTLYNSKIFSSIIILVMSLVVIIICFLIGFMNQGLAEFIRDIFRDKDLTFVIINLVIIVLLELIYMLFCGIIGMIFGHRYNDGRVIKSVFVGFILYFSVQFILLGLIYSVGLLSTDLNALLLNKTTDIINPMGTLKSFVLLVVGVYLLFISLMYLVGRLMYVRGVNVE